MLHFQVLQIAAQKRVFGGKNAPAGVFGASKNLVMSDSGFCINPLCGEKTTENMMFTRIY